jgi:molybdenum cofactor biosynthesis enzyme
MRQLVWSLLIVAVITAAIVRFVLWDERRTSQRLSQEAEAIGFTALPTQWYDSVDERNVSGHTLTYAYTAGEQVITRTLEQITWYEPERKYKVCYNPADPNDSKLYPADHVCGQ